MNVKEENICRLCLKVAENDFEMIDDITRNMFEVLSLRVNLDISKDPVICKDCAEVMVKCFNFKSICDDTAKLRCSFTIDENRAMCELKDGRKIETVDDNLICQFCSNHLSGNNFVLLDTLMNDITFAEILQALITEMDCNIIKNSVICTSCRQDLEYYIKFVENCWDVEEKITKYLQNEGTSSSAQVKLSEIQHFFNKNILKSDYIEISAIKQEDIYEDIGEAHSEVYEGELIKVEEAVDIKDEEVNLNESACETSSDMPVCDLNIPFGLCDMQSDMIPSETGMGKSKYKVYKKMKQILSTKPEVFKCAMCTYQAKHKKGLKNHMLIHKETKEKEMHKCSKCNYETKYKFSLLRHTIIHKDITEVELHKCSMCAYETKDKRNLKSHMIIHTAVKMYKCSMCTFKTKYQRSLKNHMVLHKDIDEVEYKYECSICTFKTKQNAKLRGHMLIHKDIAEVKMHKCSMCSHETKYKGSLIRHMLIHKGITEVEMYKCPMCTYQTKQKGNLKSHMLINKTKCKDKLNSQIHKDITDVEMCKFSIQTKQEGDVKNNLLIHEEEVKTYKCAMCTYETKHKGTLVRHLLTHKDTTEVEMYKCPKCTFQTKQKGNLKTHMLIHKDIAEVKMYKCANCTYETKQKSNLKRHVLIHKDITEEEMYKRLIPVEQNV